MKNSLSSINDIASRKYHIKGFTLIELLIYTGISVIIGGLTVGILLTVTRVNQNASATAEVSGQMNFVLQRLQQLVSESSNIEIEVATTTSALKLRMQDSAKDPTCISLVNGVIKIAEGPGSPNANDCNSTTSDLTSPKVVVNTLNFKKMVQYPGHDTLSLDMTMAYNTTNPGSQVSRSLSSAIARVSAATFDSDVIPGGTYEFSLGQTGAPWFKTITADGTAANPSYTFANNTGTGLFRAGANILGFTTAGLERMRIDASGNVGIGTTSPTSKLEVAGNIEAENYCDENGQNCFDPVNAQKFYRHTIDVAGTCNNYYQVVIMGGDQTISRRIKVHRSYSTDPDGHVCYDNDATPGSHVNALLLEIDENQGGWGGQSYWWEIENLQTTYHNGFADAGHTGHGNDFYVMLLGGYNSGEDPMRYYIDLYEYDSTVEVKYSSAENVSYGVAARDPITTINTANINAHRALTGRGIYSDGSNVGIG
ncbi:hypothetical protein COY31_02735, partial [Candidatus Wolfebacteria bacterium CG_4_10_14_0_2_um_filter_39_18]